MNTTATTNEATSNVEQFPSTPKPQTSREVIQANVGGCALCVRIGVGAERKVGRVTHSMAMAKDAGPGLTSVDGADERSE